MLIELSPSFCLQFAWTDCEILFACRQLFFVKYYGEEHWAYWLITIDLLML